MTRNAGFTASPTQPQLTFAGAATTRAGSPRAPPSAPANAPSGSTAGTTVHFVPLSPFRLARGTKRTVEVRNVPRLASIVAGGTKCTLAAATDSRLPYPAAVDFSGAAATLRKGVRVA